MATIAIDGLMDFKELRRRRRALDLSIEVRSIGLIDIKLDRTPFDAAGGVPTEFAFSDHQLAPVGMNPDGTENVLADPTALFVAVIRRELDADGAIVERLTRLYVRNRLVINERDCVVMMHRLVGYIFEK